MPVPPGRSPPDSSAAMARKVAYVAQDDCSTMAPWAFGSGARPSLSSAGLPPIDGGLPPVWPRVAAGRLHPASAADTSAASLRNSRRDSDEGTILDMPTPKGKEEPQAPEASWWESPPDSPDLLPTSQENCPEHWRQVGG